VEEHGPEDGPAVILLHGFPYAARCYDAVVPRLPGRRVLVPHLRGYGRTRLRPGVPRSGAQGALGADLLALMDALAIPSAILAGYDWGGRAACVVAALHPGRCAGLVTCTGYNIQDIAGSAEPQPPDREMRHWYQYYFHSERGARGLAQNRAELCRLLWRLWSPEWRFTEEDFAASAAHFDNPDFVEVVIHSYRHRFGLVDIAAYAQRVGETWKIGRRDVGDGLLIVVAKDDRRLWIAPAKALEGAVPDLAARQIVRDLISPAFKAGDYAGGLERGVDALIARIQGEGLPQPARAAEDDGGPQLEELMIFFFVAVPVISAVLSGMFGRKLGALFTGGVAGGVAGWVTHSVLLSLVAGVVALVLVGVFGLGAAARRVGRARGGRWSHGGGWSAGSGGWSAGGSGGGSGGFGGFSSGGGGDFGGGGAGGDW